MLRLQRAAKVMVAEENLARVRTAPGAAAGTVATAEARLATPRLASATAATGVTSAQTQMTAAQAAAAQQSRTFGPDMCNASSQGSAAATRFHRTNGVASAGIAAVGKGASGLMGMKGGLFGAAMIGARPANVEVSFTTSSSVDGLNSWTLFRGETIVGNTTRSSDVTGTATFALTLADRDLLSLRINARSSGTLTAGYIDVVAA